MSLFQGLSGSSLGAGTESVSLSDAIMASENGRKNVKAYVLEGMPEASEAVINLRADAFCAQGRLQSVENENMTRDELRDAEKWIKNRLCVSEMHDAVTDRAGRIIR